MAPEQTQPPGLPPVTPPSGRFIAQLFLVPGTIVFLAVMLLMLFRFLFGGTYTSKEFLNRLSSSNADIRWRAASDLAQILEKPESIALRTDVDFALDLTARLDLAIDDFDADEVSLNKRLERIVSEDEKDRERRTLVQKRNYVTFLTNTVSRFHAPVAVAVLGRLAQRPSENEKSNTLLRRQALWALAILGDDVQKFSRLPVEHRSVVLTRLRNAAEVKGAKGIWAGQALAILDPANADSKDAVRVDEILANCAKTDDLYQREQVAMAFHFWDGPLAEPTLLKLSRDSGRGELVRINEID